MPLQVNKTDESGQLFSHWRINTVHHMVEAKKYKIHVVGFKDRAAYVAKLKPIELFVFIEGAAYQRNMTMAEIEAFVMASPEFAGSTTVA